MFIAIESPPEVKEALKRAQQSLRGSVDAPGIRWTSQEQFHLTLTFLGNIGPAVVEPLSGSVGEACRGFGALRLQAQGIGFFPSPRKPRVIWSGVTDSHGRLRDLQQLIAARSPASARKRPKRISTATSPWAGLSI